MSNIVNSAFDNLDLDNEKFVNKNISIVEEVHRLMEIKGLTQKEFTRLLGKKESEISKWLSGLQNLTLRSIAKMEVALGEDLIVTCSEAKRRFGKIKLEQTKPEVPQNNLSFVEIREGSTSISEQKTEELAA